MGVRIISDNGSQFISKDFKELIVLLNFGHTFTSANHPQSNGKLERFNRTLKTEHVRRSAYIDYQDACNRMAQWINHYNFERLHGAIWYLTPDDVFYGKMGKRLAERKVKLHTASIRRLEYWRIYILLIHLICLPEKRQVQYKHYTTISDTPIRLLL